MISITKDCLALQLEVPNVFGGDIKSIQIEGQYNCCDNIYDSEFDFIYPEEPCSWKASYFVNLSLEDPRTVLFSFEFQINNLIINILEEEIDAVEAGDSLEDVLNNWLSNNGYNQSSATVLITPPTEEGFIIDVSFSNLPNGVHPERMIFVGDDRACADQSTFECVNNSDCLTYRTEQLLGLQTYALHSIMYQNAEGEFITTTFTDTEFNYNPLSPVIPATAINNVLDQFEGDFNLSILVTNHILTILATGVPEDQRPIYFLITEGGIPYQLIFNCSGFSEPISCIHVSEIETNGFTNFSTVLALLNDNATPVPISFESYTLDQIDLFISDMRQWIIDNGYGNEDVDITYEYTDGEETESFLTLTFENLFNTITPTSVLLSTAYGQVDSFDINCVEFTAVPDPEQYDSTKVKFTQNFLILYPEFFGRTEELPDGIYRVKLAIDYTNEERVVEQYCLFVDCKTKCRIIDRVAEGSDLYRWYEVLKFGEECEDCDCSALCDIFEKLLKELNEGQDEDLCRCSTC